MFKGKRAEVGIGTLILFIAMILVAAIAASVLIQTATSLQNKALLTGKRTQEQISTGISVLLVYAEDGSTNNDLDNFSMKIKLTPGSEPLKLNDTLIEFDLSDGSADLEYNSTGDCETAGSFKTSTSGDGVFAATHLVEGSEYRQHYLHSGDVVKVCFASPRSITPDEDIAIRIIPKVGIPSVIETATPEVINQQRSYIFP
ncbi:MAG: archaellin/type IV pilin N-terminal domain-containing protein [Candidatus Woesearchaeota archaeon]